MVNGSDGSPADDYNNIPLDGYELVKKLRQPAMHRTSVTLHWSDPYRPI
ncbi:MAG: hypothetical protein AAGF85_17760 [Bacteroidota bacterium]